MREASSRAEGVARRIAPRKWLTARPCKSLPPSVEGRIHGTLRLVVDEVHWTKKSPGDITVIASWWGERDSAHFRPIDSTAHAVKENDDLMVIYPVKTSAILFESYISKCETIELVIVLERTHKVIGTGHIGKLSQMFTYEPYSQLIPILSNNGSRIGEIRVCLHLIYLIKNPITHCFASKHNMKQVDHNMMDNLQSCKNTDGIEKKDFTMSAKIDRSVVKTKQSEMQKMKWNETMDETMDETIDKLFTEIVARTQRLREEVSKETYSEDLLTLSDSLKSNEPSDYIAAEIAKLRKLGDSRLEMERSLARAKALNTSRSISPTKNLMLQQLQLASETIAVSDNTAPMWGKSSPVKEDSFLEWPLYEKMTYTEPKGINPLNYVDSMKIHIGSFILTSAGCRRAKDYLPGSAYSGLITYFVQFDTTFDSEKQMSDKKTKFIRIYAKKKQQVGRVIEFGSEGICNISSYILQRDFPLRFIIYARRGNQNPSKLGHGHLFIVHVARTKNLSITLDIPISGARDKRGVLDVKAELGCNSRFGQEFVDAVMSAKENVPVLDKARTRFKIHSDIANCMMSANGNRYRSATGTHSSKSSSKVSPVSAKRIECLANKNDKDLIATKDMAEHQERSFGNKKIDTSNPENATKDKILLYGLIHVAEGKDLPESNTYLVCRAFWREDIKMSQVQCSKTKNPCYNFSQLVPLIHGTELLDRIRDNYIIIEVYSHSAQSRGSDNLLGIAKLPVHELYIAYKDPHVLPIRSSSKFPVISVDDWVSINDPVSGVSCGELLALVALGTAEQIAYLEMSRNLSIFYSRVPKNLPFPEDTKYTTGDQESWREHCNTPEVPNLSSGQSTRDNNPACHVYGTSGRDLAFADYKTQESQTDISSLKDAGPRVSAQDAASSERQGLHTLVDHLANTLHGSKTKIDQSVQTGVNQADEGDRGESRLNTLNSLTDDSDSCSPRHDFQLPTEMYRSVGVGAEYDEEPNNAYNNRSSSITTEGNAEKEETSTNDDSSFFRSVVEIECGLHLPEIEGPNGPAEPSTYVTFQDSTHKLDPGGHLNSCRVTNVFMRSCNPKWNSICEAKLPTDLLLNNQKRLIFKVWYLIDPDASTEINLGKDIMIGFAAVDLSMLMAGFTAVSGWFDIMDFTEKRNGQIKISVTPLDLPLGKVVPNGAANLPNQRNLPQTHWQYPHEAPCSNTEPRQMVSYASHKDRCVQSHEKNDSVADIGYGLGDVSMSFLASSLKQKLTELDQITKRLQSRLHDVTNAAFEDDFDNDFDITEPNSDNENTDDRNGEIAAPQCAATACPANETSQTPKQCDQNVANDERQTACSVASSNYSPHLEPASNLTSVAISSEATDTGYCSGSNARLSQHPDYYHKHYKSRHGSARNFPSDGAADYPTRGTRTHINHLLDKLSSDLPPGPLPGTTVPMKRNILELFASLRNHRNNLQELDKSGRGHNTCSVPTQTDNLSEQQIRPRATNPAVSDVAVSESVSKTSEESQPHGRISTVVREELVAEENNDSSNCDELTTYLITSNIRHMDPDCILNPFLYQHLLPDLQASSAVSPEGEAVEQLDNRYARNFGAATRDSSRIDQEADAQTTGRTNVSEPEKSTELFHLSPSVSGNVDGSIDVTVIHKSSSNDLMSGNSAKSTAGVSFDKSSIQQADVRAMNHCSTVPELLAELSGVPRQAPEGGNPVEEAKTSVTTKSSDEL